MLINFLKVKKKKRIKKHKSYQLIILQESEFPVPAV